MARARVGGWGRDGAGYLREQLDGGLPELREHALARASPFLKARRHTRGGGGRRGRWHPFVLGAARERGGYKRCNHRREDTCHEERRVPWAEAALRLSPMEALSFAKLSAALKAWSSTGAAEM